MSIVETVLGMCRKSWICHSCASQDACSGSVSRGVETFARLVEHTPKPHVVVDLDSVPCLREKGRCDFLCFAEDRKRKKQWLVPIEVSRSKYKQPMKVLKQLQLGADYVERHLKYTGGVELLPIFIGRSRYNKIIRRLAVQYKGKRTRIEVLERNGRICDKMKQFMEAT